MRKALLIAVAVTGFIIAAIATAVIVKVHSVTLALQERIEAQTGGAMRYSGLPSVSFWSGRVTYRDVAIPLPRGMEGGDLARIDRLTVGLANGILSLSAPVISEAVLSGARINLVIDMQKRASWIWSGAVPPLAWRIEDSTISYLDEAPGQAFALTDVDAAAMTGTADEGLSAKGQFVWNSRPVDFMLFVRSPQRLAEGGSPVDMTLAAPSLQFEFSGQARTGVDGGISGQATAGAQDIGSVARWLGLAFPGGPGLDKLSISGAFEANSRTAAFRDADLILGAAKGRGNIGYSRQAGRSRLDVGAGVDRIDFNAFRGALSTASPLTEPWPSKSSDYSALKNFDAAIAIAAHATNYGRIVTGPAKMQMSLKDGMLDIALNDVALYGGKAAVHIAIDGGGDTPKLQVAFNGENLDGQPLLQNWLGLGALAGKLSASFTVATLGKSEAEMISNLKGVASARFVEGRVAGLDFVKAVRSVTTAILPGWNAAEGPDTVFGGLSAAFRLDDGVAIADSITLNGPLLHVSGKGEIDLLRQAVDLKIDPRIASDSSGVQFVTLPVAIVVKGPWSEPKIYPDMPGILDDPKASFDALKKLGAGSETAP